MKNTNKEKQILQFLENLTEVLGYSDDQPLCDVIKELEEDGVDVKKSVGRLKEKIKILSRKSKNNLILKEGIKIEVVKLKSGEDISKEEIKNYEILPPKDVLIELTIQEY